MTHYSTSRHASSLVHDERNHDAFGATTHTAGHSYVQALDQAHVHPLWPSSGENLAMHGQTCVWHCPHTATAVPTQPCIWPLIDSSVPWLPNTLARAAGIDTRSPLLHAIKLLEGCEHHCACRHVEAHGKGLCGEQHLDQTLLWIRLTCKGSTHTRPEDLMMCL